MIKQELEKIMADADKTVEAILGGKESIVLSAGRIMKDQKTILELGRMVIGMQRALEFSQLTLEHAIGLNYLGEGSTQGMANEAILNNKQALRFGVKDNG